MSYAFSVDEDPLRLPTNARARLRDARRREAEAAYLQTYSRRIAGAGVPYAVAASAARSLSGTTSQYGGHSAVPYNITNFSPTNGAVSGIVTPLGELNFKTGDENHFNYPIYHEPQQTMAATQAAAQQEALKSVERIALNGKRVNYCGQTLDTRDKTAMERIMKGDFYKIKGLAVPEASDVVHRGHPLRGAARFVAPSSMRETSSSASYSLKAGSDRQLEDIKSSADDAGDIEFPPGSAEADIKEHRRTAKHMRFGSMAPTYDRRMMTARHSEVNGTLLNPITGEPLPSYFQRSRLHDEAALISANGDHRVHFDPNIDSGIEQQRFESVPNAHTRPFHQDPLYPHEREGIVDQHRPNQTKHHQTINYTNVSRGGRPTVNSLPVVPDIGPTYIAKTNVYNTTGGSAPITNTPSSWQPPQPKGRTAEDQWCPPTIGLPQRTDHYLTSSQAMNDAVGGPSGGHADQPFCDHTNSNNNDTVYFHKNGPSTRHATYETKASHALSAASRLQYPLRAASASLADIVGASPSPGVRPKTLHAGIAPNFMRQTKSGSKKVLQAAQQSAPRGFEGEGFHNIAFHNATVRAGGPHDETNDRRTRGTAPSTAVLGESELANIRRIANREPTAPLTVVRGTAQPSRQILC